MIFYYTFIYVLSQSFFLRSLNWLTGYQWIQHQDTTVPNVDAGWWVQPNYFSVVYELGYGSQEKELKSSN